MDLETLHSRLYPRFTLYVCGPIGMIQSVVDIGSETGWSKHNIHYELFSGRMGGSNDDDFVVELARSEGRRIPVAKNTSLLDELLAHRVDAPSECRSGACGACLTVVLNGKIDHRDSVLSDKDKLGGTLICTCVSRAVPGETLVLDL
jgi:ferredoxin